MLDNRLKMCAEMVSGKGIACDVGTDHAHLAAELVLSGKCRRVIASDIREGPLEAAAKTVEKYGLSDKIELILSDGLKNVPEEGVSDVIIAGMGGETIADIIGNTDADFGDSVRWILQPMSKPEYLRKMLYKYKLEITSEKIVEDGGKMYVVMCAEYNINCALLTEADSLVGFSDMNDPLTAEYRSKDIKRLNKVADSLEQAGKKYEAAHYKALACKLENGFETYDIHEIYAYLNELYPFNTQEKWDNSGIIVDNYDMKCDKVILALDITNRVVTEADRQQAQLIISHHPVIFDPLKKLSFRSPVYALAERNIAAICMHTNLDKSPNGTNGVIFRRLSERFELEGEPELFEDCGNGIGFGFVCELKEKMKSKEFGMILKEIFGCETVRTSADGRYMIKRFAFCSGSGGSMLSEAVAKNCQAYITGDVKHDVWIDANNISMALFDCGHFHTENLVLEELRYVLEQKFPQLDIEISEHSTDPCVYI
ncbi:MAG: Nif3-like dinuclear metal center hexameric protein [Ruminococcus sp.]|nr:Nif3-like dinuclear metal center hexameric protein [Ruminococcus sp.]